MKLYIKKSLYPLILLAILAIAIPANAETGKILKNFSVNNGGTLVLESNQGSVYVDTWDRDEVSVSVRLRASSRKRIEGFEVKIEQKGNDIYVKGENGQDNRIGVEFNINIPKKYNVNLKTDEGSIRVADIKGNVKLLTSDGSITIGNVTDGDVDAQTSGDRIKVGNVKGKLKVDSSGGSIRLGEITGKSCVNDSGCHI